MFVALLYVSNVLQIFQHIFNTLVPLPHPARHTQGTLHSPASVVCLRPFRGDDRLYLSQRKQTITIRLQPLRSFFYHLPLKIFLLFMISKTQETNSWFAVISENLKYNTWSLCGYITRFQTWGEEKNLSSSVDTENITTNNQHSISSDLNIHWFT